MLRRGGGGEAKLIGDAETPDGRCNEIANLKLCLNTWMWRDQPLADVLATTRELEVGGVELDVRPGSPHFDPLAGRDEVVALKSQLGELRVQALAADNPDLTRLEEDGGDEAVAHLVAALKRAADLRAGVVTTSLGASDVDAWDTVWQRGLSALRMALFQTARSPVRVAVVLSGDDALNSIRKVRRLLEGVNDPRLGLAIDTGWLHYLRIPLPEALLAAGDRLYHVRLRDATRRDFNRPLGQGEVNFPALIRQLRQHRYGGAISLSLSEPPTPEALELARGLLRVEVKLPLPEEGEPLVPAEGELPLSAESEPLVLEEGEPESQVVSDPPPLS
jgi:sugar phosphate isomerase/epimerase